MTRETVRQICAPLPGAACSDPFGGGHDCWKVGDKIFALVGGDGIGVSVKCADTETAAMLIDIGVGRKAPYLHRSWVLLPFDTTGTDELRHRIEISYGLIRGKLSKAAQAKLG